MLTDAEMQDIANAHAAEHYGVEWDAEARLTLPDPRGTYYGPHEIGTPANASRDPQELLFIGDGGFFVYAADGAVRHFWSDHVIKAARVAQWSGEEEDYRIVIETLVRHSDDKLRSLARKAVKQQERKDSPRSALRTSTVLFVIVGTVVILVLARTCGSG